MSGSGRRRLRTGSSDTGLMLHYRERTRDMLHRHVREHRPPLPLNTLLPVTYSTLLTSACVDTRAEAWTSLFPESMTEFLIDFLGGSGERQKHQYLDLTLSRCPLSHHSRNTPQEEEQLFISIYDPV